MASYEYSPLDRSRKSIRLLQFELPPPGCDTICCSLDDYDLDTCPPFAALSYTWGEPDTGTDIYLDWTLFPVRQNLHAALSAIRHFEDQDQTWVKTSTALTDFTSHLTDLPQLMATLKMYTADERWMMVVDKILKTPCVMIRDLKHGNTDVQRAEAHCEIFQTMMGPTEYEQVAVEWEHRYYWIDAICINQQDDTERGHQVNFMGDIYRRARSVLAWLGPATAASDRVLSSLARLSWPLDEESRLSLEEDMTDIGERSYWQRLWTAQEFILPQDVSLVCGHQNAPLYRLVSLFDGVNLDEFGSGRALPMFKRIDARNGRWSERSSRITIDELILEFQSAHCSDTRDRLYAVLSLLRNDSQEIARLEPDYTISASQLYYRVLGRRRQRGHKWIHGTGGFRRDLRKALDVPDDQSFRRNDLLYQFIQIGGPHEPLWPSDASLQPYHGLLRDMNFPGRPKIRAYGSREPQEVYQDVVGLFSDFPKSEDPMTWEAFDQLLKMELGLQLQEHDGTCEADI